MTTIELSVGRLGKKAKKRIEKMSIDQRNIYELRVLISNCCKVIMKIFSVMTLSAFTLTHLFRSTWT